MLFLRDTQRITESVFSDVQNDVDFETDPDDENIPSDAFVLNHDTVFEIVEPGSFVGLRSPANAIEPFFIAQFIDKGVAAKEKRDANGHYILAGKNYLEVSYLQKVGQKRREVFYQRPKKYEPVLIRVAEIFVSNIDMNEDLCMDINEYTSILSAGI